MCSFLLRFTCYPALVVVVSGVVAMLAAKPFCPRFDEGAVVCTNPIAQGFGEFGVGVVVITAFTVLPALAALGGLVLLVLDVVDARRRRKAKSP